MRDRQDVAAGPIDVGPLIGWRFLCFHVGLDGFDEFFLGRYSKRVVLENPQLAAVDLVAIQVLKDVLPVPFLWVQQSPDPLLVLSVLHPMHELLQQFAVDLVVVVLRVLYRVNLLQVALEVRHLQRYHSH